LLAYLRKKFQNRRQGVSGKKAARGDKPQEAGSMVSSSIESIPPAKGISPERYHSWQPYKDTATQESDLVIGFDLGTSCTKVVIQDRVLKKAWAVPFGRLGCKGNPYLLPTVLGVRSNNALTIDANEARIDALKARFLKDNDLVCRLSDDVCLSSTESVCAYIGLVLGEVRDWFWNEKKKEYAGKYINWEMNIGMPSRSYDDDGLCKKMKQLSLAGWQLSLSDSAFVRTEDVRIALRAAEAQCQKKYYDKARGELHPDNVAPAPEIIAQVIGYARSPMRINGMYLIADVGASTLDVSTFILHSRDQEDAYSILVAEVKPLGAAFLHQDRLKNAREAIESLADSKNLAFFNDGVKRLTNAGFDGISPLPEIEKLFPAGCKGAIRAYHDRNYEFLQECSRLVRQVIKVTMERRSPLSEAWRRGLPVFLCGGGSRIRTYQQMIPHAQKRLQRNTSFKGFIQRQIPKPTNLETDDIPPQDYHRMSVAYGLSFSGIDIGGITPPSDIEDFRNNSSKKRDLSDLFIDKDKV
jgi:hypothetical protein